MKSKSRVIGARDGSSQMRSWMGFCESLEGIRCT